MNTRLRALEPFARAARQRATPTRCELCAASVGEVHAHVVELDRRMLLCACAACAILFRDSGAGGGRYRTVPDRVIADDGFAPTEADWAALNIPVRLAYLVRRATTWTAFLPSPGGAVEAPLPEGAAAVLLRTTPLAAELAADVEALLIQRTRRGDAECWLVPVDVCHELVAVVRRSWRGFEGGEEADRALHKFLTRVRGRAQRQSERKRR